MAGWGNQTRQVCYSLSHATCRPSLCCLPVSSRSSSIEDSSQCVNHILHFPSHRPLLTCFPPRNVHSQAPSNAQGHSRCPSFIDLSWSPSQANSIATPPRPQSTLLKYFYCKILFLYYGQRSSLTSKITYQRTGTMSSSPLYPQQCLVYSRRPIIWINNSDRWSGFSLKTFPWIILLLDSFSF